MDDEFKDYEDEETEDGKLPKGMHIDDGDEENSTVGTEEDFEEDGGYEEDEEENEEY